jgi:hypothetical protein
MFIGRFWSFGIVAIALALVLEGACGLAQESVGFPPVESAAIRKIEAQQVREPMRIDGKLDEPDWNRVGLSESFVDLVSGQPTHLKKRCLVRIGFAGFG